MSKIETPQVVTIPATELNLRAGNVLRRVAVDREHVVIERSGHPIAIMLPIHDYQALMERAENESSTRQNS